MAKFRIGGLENLNFGFLGHDVFFEVLSFLAQKLIIFMILKLKIWEFRLKTI